MVTKTLIIKHWTNERVRVTDPKKIKLYKNLAKTGGVYSPKIIKEE